LLIVPDLISHSLRKPPASSHVYGQRQRLLFFGVALALGVAGLLAFLLGGCGGGSSNGGAAAATADLFLIRLAGVAPPSGARVHLADAAIN